MGTIQRTVILIDQIERADRAQGVPAWDARIRVSRAARLRPIVPLTAAAAVLAMIPLSRSVFSLAVAIMVDWSGYSADVGLARDVCGLVLWVMVTLQPRYH
jgi:multidrug efflux pump subunit AcrB